MATGDIRTIEAQEQLLEEATRRRYSRRQILRRGAALGLAVPAINAVLAGGVGAGEEPDDPVMVSLLDVEMSKDEIAAAIQEEGEVVVGNWTYTANDAIVEQFQRYVQDTYGVDITLIYDGTQAPSTYLTNLYTAVRSGNPSPYDVLAIEENYWAEARSQPEEVMEEFLPSGLIPNAERVIESLRREPTAIGFQASASPSIVYNGANVDFLTDWNDLADERLQGRLTLPLPGDITAGGFLIGLAGSLGLDYANADDMQEAIDFAVDEIGPNVVNYTTDSAVMQQLLRGGAVDAVGFWNSLARMEFLQGQEDTRALVAESGQYMANGYMWIPKNPQHPVLAQIFINWRLSDDGQFPGEHWGIENGPWAEYNEGLLGPSYEDNIPEWFADDYFTYYPTIDELEERFRTIDWDIYAEEAPAWMDYYSERLGL